MELRQLEYFVAVAEERSFTRAAIRTHVAQPGVSAQIKQLEREFGERLFDRSGRDVQLTEAGAVALVHARTALTAVDSAREAVAELTGLVRGRVAVGSITAGGVLDLPEMLAQFHRRHPRVEISLTEAGSDILFAKVRHGELDLAWAGRAADDVPTGVETQTVVSDSLVAVVALDHPLAVRRTITMGELATYPLICLPPGTGTRGALEGGFTAAAVDGRVRFEASAPLVTAELAARGLGVGVVPQSAAEFEADRLHMLRITRPRLRSRLELAWRVDGTGKPAGGPAARALVAHARAFVRRR